METYSPSKLLSFINQENEEIKIDSSQISGKLVTVELLSAVLHLKVVSATFLLVCVVCLKESTCETRKNVFDFTSRALFVLEIIKF